MYLEHIATPADVRALPEEALPALCAEIRRAIVESSAAVGGHVGPNLGAVELTVALHRVFDDARDRIVFDVSHQTYAHKMLTGRAPSFLDPARYDEVSGFSSPCESSHDLFAMGHTSTSISLATGLAHARDLAGENYDVVAVIGDGALSGGLAFEGLNNAVELGSGLIVVVNDNEWSIAPDAGGIYKNLETLRRTQGASPNNVFRALGFDYRYVEGGHDVAALEAALAELKGAKKPTVLHIHTVKGKGYAPAEADPESWHHVGPFDLATGVATAEPAPDYAELTGAVLAERMAADRRVVAVSAATPYIMGFTPERRTAAGAQFVDVGIAEEHAVTYAAALAKAGAKPVLGIYSVFLQRAYDELWHDLCLNAAPAVLLVFGASAFGTTDATHLGFFDIPMLSSMPGLPYLAPTCAEEYQSMLEWALAREEGPIAIRVPVAGGVTSRPGFAPAADYASGSELVRPGQDVAVLALGDLFGLGEKLADELARHGIDAALVNPRLANAANEALLADLADSGCHLFVTLEDGILPGGFGEKCAAALADRTGIRVIMRGLPRAFVDRYEPAELLAEAGLTVDALAADVLEALGR